MNIFRFAIALALLLACEPAVAQYQVPNHSVPIGRGSGVTGYGKAAPGVAGMPVVSNGTSADPSFQPVPNSGLVSGPAGTVKGSTDGVTVTDSPLLTLLNATCNSIPTACTALLGYVSPLWYGAVCDGATHDEVALQAAMNAAQTARLILQMPPLNCVSNATLTNGTTLFGDTLIQGYGNISRITFLGNSGFAFNGTANYYVMQDMTITCQPASFNPCIQVFNTQQSTAIGSIFQRIYMPAAGAYGMYFQNMVQARVINNNITTASSSSIGIFIDNTQTADVGGNMIRDNLILNLKNTGPPSFTPIPAINAISLLNVGGTLVIGNAVDGYITDILSTNTLTSGASTGLQIQNNQVDDFSTAGISLVSAGAGGFQGHVNISGNVLHARQTASANAGIIINENPSSTFWAFSFAITGNQVDTVNGNVGILVAGTGGYTVSGNLVADDGGSPPSSGIVLTASGNTCTVVGNAISGYAGHVSNSAGCAVTGNN